MPKQSAGLLMYRKKPELQVFLVHPGGPFWAKKDLGAWSIAKGEFKENEEPLNAAKREFEEETSFVPRGPFIPLSSVKQKSGKVIHAWAFEGDADPKNLKSNKLKIKWPPVFGKEMEIPEVDKGEWFSIPVAEKKINPAQIKFLDELQRLIQ